MAAKNDQHTEIELKLEGSPEAFDRIRGDLAQQLFTPATDDRDWRVQTYYDTRDLDLFAVNLELRVRPAGSGYRQTLKYLLDLSDTGVFTRDEIQVNQDSELPTLKTLKKYLPKHVTSKGGTPLHPLIRTEFKRTRFVVQVGVSQIEVALDDGHVVYIGRDAELVRPFHMMELEVKTGEAKDIVSLSRILQDRYTLTPMFLSKPEQAVQLAYEAGELDGTPAFKTVASKLKDRLR